MQPRRPQAARSKAELLEACFPQERRGGPVARRAAPRAEPAARSNSSTWEEEAWRLERLFSGSGDFGIREEGPEAGRVVRLRHHCSDPDWQAVNWAPEGLLLEVDVPGSYPEARLGPAALRLLEPASLPPRFARALPALFAEASAVCPPRSPAVYRALQHVDRHMAALYLRARAADDREAEALERQEARDRASEATRGRSGQAEPKAGAAASAPAPGGGGGSSCSSAPAPAPAPTVAPAAPWSSQAQSLLEAAILEFRAEPDPKRRWALIGQRVGRSARDCAERFRECRRQVLSRKAGAEAEADGEEDGDDDSEPQSAAAPQPAPAATTAWSAADVRRTGVEVRLLGLTLEGFSVLLMARLRLQAVCGRCKKPLDFEVQSARGEEACTAECACPICKQELALRVAPSFFNGGCPTVAHVLGVNCHPSQFLRSDFQGTCDKCDEDACIRSAGAGYRKRAECPKCYARLNLAIEGAELLGPAVERWRRIAQEGGDQVTARKRLQEARRQEKALGVVAGQPLPGKGACKHYTKSYRWLRFPCCGRAFPCDTCHDEQMDHPHEWANRMLCGMCAHEQPFSKDSCLQCGAAQTRSKTSHWEGGDGCRNRATMSRNDTHKYKGLGKTVSSKAAKSAK